MALHHARYGSEFTAKQALERLGANMSCRLPKGTTEPVEVDSSGPIIDAFEDVVCFHYFPMFFPADHAIIQSSSHQI